MSSWQHSRILTFIRLFNHLYIEMSFIRLFQFSLYVHKGGLKLDSFHFILSCFHSFDASLMTARCLGGWFSITSILV